MGGGFDDDFTMAGVQNTMFKGSAGQTTMVRLDALLGGIITGTVPKVEHRVKAGDRVKAANHFLKGSGKKGPPTILLDEPERSFDLPTQVMLWKLIRSFSAAGVQITSTATS